MVLLWNISMLCLVVHGLNSMGLYAITIVVLIVVCQANMTLLIPLENNVLAHYANIKRLDKKQVVDSNLHCSDRKSTRLNSSHTVISYAVFCLKKKKK